MNYIINEQTQAIATVRLGDNRTKIYEMNNVMFSKTNPLTILKNSCEKFGYSLLSWRELIEKQLQRSSKLPIPISPSKGIFFVPTTSDRNEQCVWVSYYHVNSYFEENKQLNIVLQDGQSILSDISLNQFKLQLKRTCIIIAYFYRLFNI